MHIFSENIHISLDNSHQKMYDTILYHYGDKSAVRLPCVFGLNNIADSYPFVKYLSENKIVIIFTDRGISVFTNIKKE